MTVLRLFRSRAGLIAAVFAASLISGALLFLLPPPVHEVSMLMEVRLSTIGPYSEQLTWTVRQTIESGALNDMIARKSGLKGPKDVPKLRAKIMYATQLIKVYAFVPSQDVERTKTALVSLLQVLNEGFSEEDASHTRRVSLAVEKAARLEKAKKDMDARLDKAQLSPDMNKVSGELTAWTRDLSGMLREYWDVIQDAQTLHTYRIKMVSPPAVSDSPEGLSPLQVLIAFGLLGLMAGLSAALWSEDRKK